MAWLALAAAISAAAAFVAWRAGTLTASGAVAAWTIGVLVLYGTGWQGGAVLAVFFVSSNLVSRVQAGPLLPGLDPKSDRRDHWQVYANGAAAAVGGAIGLIDPTMGLWLVTISFAAAAADTWATAVGSRSQVSPTLLWFGPPVAAGSSGGMTTAGMAGATVGALIVAGTGAVVAGLPILLPVGTLIGFLGMVADSALGALLQGRFRCPACQAPSEWRVHRCGTATARESGLAWLNNDGVNFLATIMAAVGGWAAFQWLTPF